MSLELSFRFPILHIFHRRLLQFRNISRQPSKNQKVETIKYHFPSSRLPNQFNHWGIHLQSGT